MCTDIAVGGTYLLWKTGVQYNTTVKVGDRVTWVWDGDEPLTIKSECQLLCAVFL